MQELIKINNKNIEAKEWKGNRVVTFSDIDNVHNRPEGTARRNFSKNKDRLKEGLDYFQITKSQKNEFRTLEIPNRGLTVLTESGYLLLVKSFTDDLAWEVQRALVNVYFKAKSMVNDQIKEQLAEARRNNAQARKASLYLKLADRVQVESYKQVLYAYSAQALSGEQLLPLPKAPFEKLLTAEDIAAELGISPQKVGRIANAHGIKNEANGVWVWDKSRSSNYQCQVFRYFPRALAAFRAALEVA